MHNTTVVDFSHLSQLPTGDDEEILVTRETALEEVIKVVIEEVKKYGFDYPAVILAISHYAHTKGMRTIEFWLEAAYFEALGFTGQRQTREAAQEVIAEIREIKKRFQQQ